jgi:hypothetical protein
MRKQQTQVSRLSISSKLAPVLILGMMVMMPPLISQTALSITVSTNKAQFLPGETVSISGVVGDNQSNPVFGAGVSIQVNDPRNKVVQVQLVFSDRSGAYVDPLVLRMDSIQGQYSVYASASKSGYSNGQNQTQFTVLTQTTSTSTSATSSTTSSLTSHTATSSSSSSSATTNPMGKCLIATATYGSELAPEVTLLRDFRDSEVLRTSAGESFMLVFNAFYYSFSPGVASFIASHNNIKTGMKILLYPLIGILHVSSLMFAATSFNTEIAVTVAGVLASFGIGVVYLGPILTVLSRLFKSRSSPRYFRAIRPSFLLVVVSLMGLLLAEFGQLSVLMEATTVGVVLSSIALGGLLLSWIMARLWSGGHM